MRPFELHEVCPSRSSRHEEHGEDDEEPGRHRPRTVVAILRLRAWSSAFVGLGSNLGERRETLRAAIGRLRGLAEVDVKGVSSFRDTEPVDYLDQPRFLNGAVEIETDAVGPCAPGCPARAGARLRPRPEQLPRRTVRGLSTSTCCSTETRRSTSLSSRSRTRVCTSAGSSSSRLQSWIRDLEVPGQGSVQALLARLDSAG